MLTSLLLLASFVGPAAARAASDPPIRLWYSAGGDYTYGERAKVYAKAAESGGREAFVAEDTTGQGTVLAAWSKTPFDVSGFTRNGLRDYDPLAREGSRPSTDDAEAQMIEIVLGMQRPAEHFDYDLATYTVSAPSYARGFLPVSLDHPRPFRAAGSLHNR